MVLEKETAEADVETETETEAEIEAATEAGTGTSDGDCRMPARSEDAGSPVVVVRKCERFVGGWY